MSPLLLLLGAGALVVAWRRSRVDPYAPLGTVTLYQGVPYRMAIRSNIGSGTADVVTRVQDTVRDRILGTAGTSAPSFFQTNTPPVWLPAGALDWGRMLTVFDVTPAKTQDTALGRALEGIGNVEWILRLDGKNFGEPPG